MKKYSYCLLGILFAFPLLVMGQARIQLDNPAAMARTEEVVSIPWKTILSVYPGIDTGYFAVIDPVTKKQVPYQLEYKGNPGIQNLLVQVSMPAKSKLVLAIKKMKPEVFPAKTYCRYVPERKDDFAWENDRIAFRAYGKALENTVEDAYGLDVWVKRTTELVLNKRYKLGDYHNDHGDGMDYYHVGFSLGAGNVAPYVNDSIWYSHNYRNWKILDNGPLRTSFELEFDTWMVGDKKVKAVKSFSIDAGVQMHKVAATYFFDGPEPLPLVVGIIKRDQPGESWLSEQQGMMGYWEPKDDKNGTTGVGCVFSAPVQTMMIRNGQFLSLQQARSGEPLVYYRGAAWDKAGRITSASEWFKHIRQYQQQLNSPIRVTVQR